MGQTLDEFRAAAADCLEAARRTKDMDAAAFCQDVEPGQGQSPWQRGFPVGRRMRAERGHPDLFRNVGRGGPGLRAA